MVVHAGLRSLSRLRVRSKEPKLFVRFETEREVCFRIKLRRARSRAPCFPHARKSPLPSHDKRKRPPDASELPTSSGGVGRGAFAPSLVVAAHSPTPSMDIVWKFASRIYEYPWDVLRPWDIRRISLVKYRRVELPQMWSSRRDTVIKTRLNN